MGIDKGNTNDAVMEFDSLYGVYYPSASGSEGGGNPVHFQYDILGTPTIIVITPDHLIVNQQISPPSTTNVVEAVTNAGGIQQSCLTSVGLIEVDEMLTIGPNPVRARANISIFLQEAKNLEVAILTMTGQQIVSYNPALYSSGRHILQADLSDQPEGFYVVIVRENKRILSTKKLILIK